MTRYLACAAFGAAAGVLILAAAVFIAGEYFDGNLWGF
jgi:hypothetical protein